MSDCLCDICKKKPAIIQITGEGKFCLDCHNERILKRFGVDNTFQYAPTMAVMEPGGVLHTFKIEHMILGATVRWEANEIGGGYHFCEISDIRTNGSAVARKFFQKIVDGVCTKSLENVNFSENIPGMSDLNSDSLRDKGTIHIVEDETRENAAAFVIDGKRFNAEEFAQLLSSYPNFMMKYQIHDESEPILKEDEYLMPVRITRQSLIDELEEAIEIHSENGFISHEATFTFDETFFKLTDKLETLYCSSKRDDAIAAGREMVRILAHTETDDDYFPRYDIELICKIVDPYGTDEEMREILQEWEDRF